VVKLNYKVFVAKLDLVTIRDLHIHKGPVHCFSILGCTGRTISNITLNNTAGYARNAVGGRLSAARN
jgi:polygalacturonase